MGGAELKKKLPKNFTVIDTPMSGSTIKAKEGTLTFMVGGNENDVQSVMPLLNILGDKILHIGKFGKGMSVKLLNNFIAASANITDMDEEAKKYQIVTKVETDVALKSIMSNSFGFGGTNATLVFEKV